MAISIEIWAGRELLGGTETWWDDFERWLAGLHDAQVTYPQLSRVDPYGFVTVSHADVRVLLEELVRASRDAPAPVAALALRLIEVCQPAAERPSAELRFVGD